MLDVVASGFAIRTQEQPVDRVVAALAERQRGVVSRRQLIGIGLSDGAIHRRIHAGRLHRLFPGSFAVGHRGVPREGYWLAAVMAAGPDAVLSHRHAGALWGLRPTSATRIDVTAPGRTRHSHSGIAVHLPRRPHPEDRAVCEGIPVTSVSRTLLDLAQVLSQRDVNRALDAAERLEIFDLSATERLLARAHGHRGLGRLKRALREYAGPPPITRSALERRFLDLCRDAGLPPPRANILIDGVEADMAWQDGRLVVELDGFAYHGTRGAFEDDRKRDATLQLAGYRVVRITHRRLSDEPGAVARLVRSLLD